MHFRWGISLDSSNVRKIAEIYCHKIVFTFECIKKCVLNISTEIEMQNFPLFTRHFNCRIASFRNIYLRQQIIDALLYSIKAWADILMRSSSTVHTFWPFWPFLPSPHPTTALFFFVQMNHSKKTFIWNESLFIHKKTPQEGNNTETKVIQKPQLQFINCYTAWHCAKPIRYSH